MMHISRKLFPVLFLLFLPSALTAQEADSIGYEQSRTALVDSLFRSIGDSTVWARELEYARQLNLDAPEEESALFTREEAPARRRRLSWREKDSIAVANIENSAEEWEPNPRAATFLALVFPGGGQIYNRKYWKLPIVYGGFVGCVYALTWNQSTYSDYMDAYVDIMDDDPNTKSYEDFLPPHYEIDEDMESWLKDVFRNRKNKYRRYRDLSIFAFAGMYVISAIDAYVDAELSHFDISPDLSLHVQPQIMIDHHGKANTGLSLALNF